MLNGTIFLPIIVVFIDVKLKWYEIITFWVLKGKYHLINLRTELKTMAFRFRLLWESSIWWIYFSNEANII